MQQTPPQGGGCALRAAWIFLLNFAWVALVGGVGPYEGAEQTALPVLLMVLTFFPALLLGGGALLFGREPGVRKQGLVALALVFVPIALLILIAGAQALFNR